MRFRACATVLALASLAAPQVRAQLIDDVELRRDAASGAAILQLRFVTAVQLRRTLASGTLLQVFYDVVPAAALPELQASERRVPASPGQPALLLSDDGDGPDRVKATSRRLLVRLATPATARVRAGAGDRTLEIVFDAAPAGPRFQIALLQSTEPGPTLDTPIPSALQRYEVFTGSRRVDGRLLHEISIGPFASEAEARAALQLLQQRFPLAVLVALAPPEQAAAGPAPAAVAPPPPPPLPAVAATPPVATVTVPEPTAPATPAPADVEAQAAALLAAARQADASNDHAFALARLNELLDLPPNASSRAAQELIGHVRRRAGDSGRARAEYETFLKLYPQGEDSERVRQALAELGASAPAAGGARTRIAAPVTPTTTLSGSVSEFFYGGQSKLRTQEFQDSPISGLPELASDNTLSGTDQRQLVTSADLNWRHRDADNDLRFVFRDAYTADLLNSAKNRNRLSALYLEHRSTPLGTAIKLGRQSPSGGGVLGRFDGVQAAYTFAPKWRVNAVLGAPADKLLDSKRNFYGAWVDADALTPQLGGSLYLNQQLIDGEVDRRAVGSEMRYFAGGVSVTGALDYDLLLRGLNIASLQGTWQSPDNTVVNLLFDRRATPILALGNALFFGAGVPQATPVKPATSVQELLAGGYDLATLRQGVKDTTTSTTQALLALTTPVDAHWQVGGDLRFTKLGDIPPVPGLLPAGQGASDNRALGAQVIATNLYSARDTHVLGVSWLSGSGENLLPDGSRSPYGYSGQLVSYNNASQLNEAWLVEPSLKYYAQSDKAGVKTTRWSPGLRVTYRAARQLAIESELSGEIGKVTGPSRNETSNRVFYYLGGRYDF